MNALAETSSTRISTPPKPANGSSRSRRSSAPTAPSARTTCSNAWSTRPVAPAATCRSRPTTEYVNTIPPHLEAKIARRCGDGVAHPLHHPLERDGDGGARQPQAGRTRRPHRQLRVERHAVRRRLQPFLARAQRGPSGRPDLLPGPFQPGHLRALVPRRALRRADQLDLSAWKSRARPGPVVVSASVADARLLAGADGIDGSGTDPGDLPGAVLEVPRAPRPDAEDRSQDLVLPGRRRDRRTRIAGRDLAGRAREAGQPGVRDQLQPAAPGRTGARQRQDHPGAGRRVPRRRLERASSWSGAATGIRSWRATSKACCAS